MIAIGVVFLWIVPLFVAYSQGKSKGRHGLVYGLVFGWLGVLILAVLSPTPRSAFYPRD